MVKYLIGALAIALSLSLAWGFRAQGKADVATVELNAAKADLASARATLESQNREALRRSEKDIAQSEARAKAAKSVRDVRTANTKEAHESLEPRAVASPAQLERLRRLSEAGNAAVQSAR
jgi:hypothetical protein